MRRGLGAQAGSALALVVCGVGCLQPLAPFDRDQGEEPPASLDASGPAASAGATPRPQPTGSDASAKPASEAGLAPPPPSAGAIDAGTLPAPPGPGLDPCTTLSPPTCSGMPGCARVDAFALDPMLGCTTGEIRPSCMQAQLGCGEIFGSLVAQGANGQLWSVPFVCVPPDLKPLAPQPIFSSGVAACPSAKAEAACAVHTDLAACRDDPHWQCMPKTAGHYNPMRGCIDLPQGAGAFLGCQGQHFKAEPAQLLRDPQGEVWEVSLSNLGVVPKTWTPIAASSLIPGAGTELPRCFTVP